MTRCSVVLLTVMVGFSGLPTRAALVPTPGLADGRIRTALYDPEQVYRLQGFVGYAIDLEFAADEVVSSVGGGDIEALTLASSNNHLTLKPKAAPLNTNFTVYTNHRAYRIDYHVATEAPELVPQSVIFVVRFVYASKPSGASSTVAASTGKPGTDSHAAPVKPPPVPNFDYWYRGDDALQPIAASDDGLQTRITFAANSEWPALYLYNDDGSESLVNFSVHDGVAVIHRVAAAFVVRRGTLSGCIANRAWIFAHRHSTSSSRQLKKDLP